MTPTARTINLLRADGWTCQVVEHWIPRVNIRRDLWGVGDVLAMKAGNPLLLIQCTTGSNAAARMTKARQEPRLTTWLATGATFEVWSWSMRGQRGKRKLWTVRRDEVNHG